MKKLLLSLFSIALLSTAFAQDQPWNPVGCLNSMVLKGVISIDNAVPQMPSSNLEVGAFCDGECRATAFAGTFPVPGMQVDYWVNLTIGGNSDGEIITFRLYDHESGLYYESDCTVTFENLANIGTPGNWFQLLFYSPTPQPQTFTLDITGYGTTDGNYYLIAPPFDDINPAEIEGMVTGTGEYDLYYFDQAQELEWRNYKEGAFNLESGKGYLYAHDTDVTLSFTGVPYSGDGKVTLRKTGGLDFEGWNLVGNPFATAATLDRPFYVMNPAGTEIITATGTGVAAMQGIFVIANSDNEQIQFTQSGSGSKDQIVLNVLQDRGNTIDRAIVRFNENSTLPKFMLNDSNTKLYIPQEDDDYAVVNSNGANSMPVNFKAMANGTYTLSVDINLDMEYLHLIDNKTGADIDLLVQPDYQFAADKNDNEARFMLVFRSTTGVEENGQQNFCFVKGSNLYFNEDVQNAELSLVDVTGRLVRQMTLKGNSCDLSGISEGLYIVRLAKDNEVKVQKVVIR